MALDISKLGRKTFVSQAALAEILSAVKEAGEIPEATSRSTVKRRRQEAIDIETPYGPVISSMELDALDGSKVKVPFCNPAAWLHYCSRNCRRMQNLLDGASATPNNIRTPWQLIIYLDEVSPGNALKVHNRRKLQCIYWAFQEIGGIPLTQEHSWNVLTCVRTDTVNRLKSGLSQLFRRCIHTFYSERGDMSYGISLQICGREQICCFSLAYVLGDEAALKQCYENKGAAGRMLCMFCQTTVAKRYAPNPLGRFILHTVDDASQLCLHSDSSVWQVVDHIHAQSTMGLTKKAFAELESKLGFNHTPDGALLDLGLRRVLKPISMTCFDAMHVFLVAGVWRREMSLLLVQLAACGYRQAMLHDWAMSCVWPDVHGGKACSARLIFKKKKDPDAEFKCTASEGLAAYPIVKAFLLHNVHEPAHDLRLAMQSYYSLCAVLDSLKLTATGSIQPATFLDQIQTHLRHFKVSWVCCESKFFLCDGHGSLCSNTKLYVPPCTGLS